MRPPAPAEEPSSVTPLSLMPAATTNRAVTSPLTLHFDIQIPYAHTVASPNVPCGVTTYYITWKA